MKTKTCIILASLFSLNAHAVKLVCEQGEDYIDSAPVVVAEHCSSGYKIVFGRDVAPCLTMRDKGHEFIPGPGHYQVCGIFKMADDTFYASQLEDSNLK